MRDPPQRVPADVALLIEEANRFPFVERITSHEPYEELSYECTLDVERFPFLEDHAIDEVPYHPGVMAMEMFAEAAQLLWPPCTVIGFEQVEFGLPVKLMREQQKVRVRAQFERQDDASIWVRCSLESDLVNKEGVVFGEPRLHHQGTVRLLKQGADRGLRRLPSIGAPSSTGISFQPSFIYKRFFHGPRFQAHGGISRGCRMDDCLGADGIALMRHQLPNPQQFEGEPVELEAMPMLIEACFQNAGMVASAVDWLQSLPVGVEQVEVIRHPGGDERPGLRAVRRGSSSARQNDRFGPSNDLGPKRMSPPNSLTHLKYHIPAGIFLTCLKYHAPAGILQTTFRSAETTRHYTPPSCSSQTFASNTYYRDPDRRRP